RFGRRRVEAGAQLAPERVVAPAFHLVVERALHVIAAARRRAHAAEGKAALVVGVDEFVRNRRRLREHAEPAEGIDALEGLERALGDALAADAVVTVAAGDEVAVQLVLGAVLAKAYRGAGGGGAGGGAPAAARGGGAGG